MERQHVALKMQHAETKRQLEDLSNSFMVLQDRLETLKVAADRRPASPAPQKKVITQTKPKSVAKRVSKPTPSTKKGKSVFGFGEAGGSHLPVLQFSNRDLEAIKENLDEPDFSPSVSAKKAPNHPDNPDAARAYNEAFAKFESGKYAEAVRMLETFVKSYPNHVYSDNAVFWIGESYYRKRDFGRAAEQFERVGREFPAGNKVPDAILRSASCYLRLNQLLKAQKAFEKIIATYPQSVAAQKARASLAEISDTSSGQRRM